MDILQLLSEFNLASVTVRILLAAVIGGSIGIERSYHGQAAGLRTHILVCLGSTVTALVGIYVYQVLHFTGDPMRISAQVISGIGFLGAGAILTKNNTQVSGLTTAAGLWATACIGLSIGVGFYWAAVLAAVCIVVSVRFLGHSSRLNQRKRNILSYYIELSDISCVESFLANVVPRYSEVRILPAQSGSAENIGLLIVISDSRDHIDLFLQKVHTLDYVKLAIPTEK